MKINSLSMIFEGEAVTILSTVGGNPSLMCYILVMSLGHLLKETFALQYYLVQPLFASYGTSNSKNSIIP